MLVENGGTGDADDSVGSGLDKVLSLDIETEMRPRVVDEALGKWLSVVMHNVYFKWFNASKIGHGG